MYKRGKPKTVTHMLANARLQEIQGDDSQRKERMYLEDAISWLDKAEEWRVSKLRSDRNGSSWCVETALQSYCMADFWKRKVDAGWCDGELNTSVPDGYDGDREEMETMYGYLKKLPKDLAICLQDTYIEMVISRNDEELQAISKYARHPLKQALEEGHGYIRDFMRDVYRRVRKELQDG